MKDGVIVGVDTSNYTTSLGILSEGGELIANLKRPLPVSLGERGLRQSDAVFHHVKNMPELIKEARDLIDGREIKAVGVSSRPRNREGSYMPCFLVGVNTAEAFSLASGAELFTFSHQCGHIMAALYSAGVEAPERFFAFHISGGTTELVLARRTETAFVCETLGGTKDLNAGQIIDRIGVSMDFPFPSGRYVEEAALRNTSSIPRKKPPVTGTYANLSGLENMAAALYKKTSDKELVSAFVLDYLGRAIEMICDGAKGTFGDLPFVFAGGVMSNSLIKARLKAKFSACFAEPALSADNAVGIAALAYRAYNYRKGS